MRTTWTIKHRIEKTSLIVWKKKHQFICGWSNWKKPDNLFPVNWFALARAKRGWDRVVECSKSHSRLAWNSYVLSTTLVKFEPAQIVLESRRGISLVWPEVMIVDESWRKLSWEPTLISSHPRLAQALFNCGKIDFSFIFVHDYFN